MNKTTRPTFTTSTDIIKGQETVIVEWEGQPNFDDESRCCVCNLKVRGAHSYAVHMSVNGYLIPVDQFENDYDITQGFFAIGSECRKQLPATHSMKVEW